MDEPRLRPATVADAPGILEIYAPIVRETAISFEYQPPGKEEVERRIRTTGERFPWLVAELGGALVGYAYATTFRAREAYDWTVESTVYVHPDHRGAGVASALMHALVRVLRALGYRTVVAGIALPNEASVRLHESLGFRGAGAIPRAGRKQGAWHDIAFLALDLGDATDLGDAVGARSPLRPAELAELDQLLR